MAPALRARVRREVPAAAGVYLFRDEAGNPLYVGKSVNLRERMLSHLAAHQTDPASRNRHLAFSIHDFEVTVAAGELAALLLEDALIKQLRPRANTRQLDYAENCYVLLTTGDYPTCRIVESNERGAGELFGPFRDRHFAADLLAIIHRYFGLRACADRAPFRRSARYDLGSCSGPCRDAITPEAYAIIVGRVEAFLRGEGAWIAGTLAETIGSAAGRLAFEEAAVLRDTSAFCRRFTRRQRFAEAFKHGRVEVVERGTAGRSYRFERGAVARIEAGGQAVAVPQELSQPPADERFLLDRAHLVYDWLNRGRGAVRGDPA